MARHQAGAGVTALIRYEAARAALAEAKAIDEVKDVRDQAEAMRLYARMAGDLALELDAAEIRVRAERRLGELILAQKMTVGLNRGGRPQKTPSASEGVSMPTLKDVGIDYKLSSRAQRSAGIAEQAFEAMVEAMRARMAGDRHRGSLDLSGAGAPINGARAVMGSRVEPPDGLDYFPTPPWATRALIERVLPVLGVRAGARDFESVWEPACGEGHIAEVLREYVDIVHASDIFDHGYGGGGRDFLAYDAGSAPIADWIITNPPFGDSALAFVLQALKLAGAGVAMFFRSQWAVEGVERYEALFRDRAPTLCAFFVERVNLCKGRWEPDGSTATAYCWLLWKMREAPRPPLWIPPGCREQLSRPDDRARFTAHPVEHAPAECVARVEPSGRADGAPDGKLRETRGGDAPDDDLALPDFLRRGPGGKLPWVRPS